MCTPKLLTTVLALTISAFAQTPPTAMLTASDAATNHVGLGYSVAMSGSVIAAGGPGGSNGLGGIGVIYVFTKPDSAPWTDVTESARLVAPVTEGIGSSIAMNGDASVIVATTGTFTAETETDTLYVFLRPAAGWTGTITPSTILTLGPSARPYIQQGHFNSVAINSKGTAIVAGAKDYGYGFFRKKGVNIESLNRGAVYVWSEPAGGWAAAGQGMIQTAILTPSDAMTGDAFGAAVAISANTIVASATGVSNAAGATYIFQRPEKGVWVDSSRFASKLTATDGQVDSFFGWAVAAADGGALVVSTNVGNCAGNSPAAAYVFARPSRGWPPMMTQTAELTSTDGFDCFGYSVGIREGQVVVGAPDSAPTKVNQFSTGAAFSFAEPSTGWATMSALPSMVPSLNYGYFGYSTTVGGRSLAIGAPYTTIDGNASAGAVYLFSQ
jgi:hypothetical protein